MDERKAYQFVIRYERTIFNTKNGEKWLNYISHSHVFFIFFLKKKNLWSIVFINRMFYKNWSTFKEKLKFSSLEVQN